MAITVSAPQNITSPEGNSLAIYKDASNGILYLKDVNGQIEQLSVTGGLVRGTGTQNTIPVWGLVNTLGDSIVSQTTPYIGVGTGVLNINGTMKQSGTKESIYIGENVGLNVLDSAIEDQNVGIGNKSLQAFVEGESFGSAISGENVAIGYEALLSLVKGTNNIAIGSALRSTLDGANNIAFGKNALQNLGIGAGEAKSNIVMGFDALRSIQNARGGIAIGQSVLYNITSGIDDSVAIGHEIGKDLPLTTSVDDSVLIGSSIARDSLATNLKSCVLIGYQSVLNTTGNLFRTIAIGQGALQGSSDLLHGNIAIGINSNQNNTSGLEYSINIVTSDGGVIGGGGVANSYGISINTYDSNDSGIGLPNQSLGKYGVSIGGIGNVQNAENSAILGGKSNIINASATNSAILGGFDNEVQSGGSGGMALGSNLQVNGNNQVVLGRYNVPNANTKLIVGCGFSDANRKNGFEVLNTGQLRATLYGGTSFPATGSFNFLVSGSTGNILEVDSSTILKENLSITSEILDAGGVVFVSSNPTNAIKVTWSGGAGTGELRLPASFPTDRTLYVFTTASFGSGTTNIVEIKSATGELINGLASLELNTQFKSVKLYYDGSNYQTISTN